MEFNILTENLTKRYSNGTVAVKGLNLQVCPGSVMGLVGKNGSGKSTVLRLLLGLLKPTGGSATILGQSLWNAKAEQRQEVTYVSQEAKVYAKWSYRALCQYCACLYPNWDPRWARDLISRFDLDPDKPVQSMSGGQRRKVAIALAMAPRPKVILLDEPAAGLDPSARRKLIDALIDALSDREGTTVLFSTHIVSDLERIADEITLLENGSCAFSKSLDDLQGKARKVQIIFDGQDVPGSFEIEGAIKVEKSGPVYSALDFDWSEEKEAQLKASQSNLRIQTFTPNLEDILIELFDIENDEFSSTRKGA